MRTTRIKKLGGDLLLVVALWLIWPCAPVFGQAPVIASFNQNGLLVCTNLQPGSTATVEWASSVLGAMDQHVGGPGGGEGGLEWNVPSERANYFILGFRCARAASQGAELDGRSGAVEPELGTSGD